MTSVRSKWPWTLTTKIEVPSPCPCKCLIHKWSDVAMAWRPNKLAHTSNENGHPSMFLCSSGWSHLRKVTDSITTTACVQCAQSCVPRWDNKPLPAHLIACWSGRHCLLNAKNVNSVFTHSQGCRLALSCRKKMILFSTIYPMSNK